MTYQIIFYNSIDRSWRDGKVYSSLNLAARFAIDYFKSIEQDGVFGEPDKIYAVGTVDSFVWDKARQLWKGVQ